MGSSSWSEGELRKTNHDLFFVGDSSKRGFASSRYAQSNAPLKGVLPPRRNLFVRKFPQPGEETPVLIITRLPGGKAGNVAVAVTRLLGPDKVGIIGALGRDEIADTQIQLLNSEGVNTSAIGRKADTESGQAYIVTEESGENAIHTYFGANAMLKPTDISGGVAGEMFRSARITAITDPPEETVETITKIAYDAGRMIAWDPGIRSALGATRL